MAILDDDDSWAETYLERCERAVVESGLDMVAAGLVFHRFRDTESEVYHPPVSLEVSDLLVRNPHIQGSNLFVRLRRLLEAGGFDEALTSTTDRDICIRLADLGTVRYGELKEDLVHHFADNDRPRLSTPGSDAKRAGLRYFFRKHCGRMTDEQQAAFIDRSRRLFHCDPTGPDIVPAPTMPSPLVPEPSISETPLTLVVGAITSPDTRLVERLLNSLAEKVGGREGVNLRVVLLENGGHDPSPRLKLQDVVDRATAQGQTLPLRPGKPGSRCRGGCIFSHAQATVRAEEHCSEPHHAPALPVHGGQARARVGCVDSRRRCGAGGPVLRGRGPCRRSGRRLRVRNQEVERQRNRHCPV